MSDTGHHLDSNDEEEAVEPAECARVLIVDDDPAGRAGALAGTLNLLGVSTAAISPESVTQGHLDDARLILVDQRLERWTEPRDKALSGIPHGDWPVSTRPQTGVALAAVLRSQIRDGQACGVALLSANLEDLVQRYSASVTEHAAARLHDLEWAFSKNDAPGLPQLANRVIALDEAIGATVAAFQSPKQTPTETLAALFQLPVDASWAASATRDMLSTSPPVHQFAAATDGLSVVRWLSQRVLPYPTFLLDQPRVSLGLGIDPESFQANEQPLTELLGSREFRGPLRDFANRRWWRAGIQSLVRELSGDVRPSKPLVEAIEKRTGVSLAPLSPANAVLCVDGSLARHGGPVAREAAVRVRSDDWPAFAETGWMSLDYLGERPELWDLVDPADRALLRPASDVA